jgi:plasmid replication initiation protein
MEQQSLFDTDTRVVKSNELVQSRMNWTKLEHRVVAMLIAQLKKDDEQFTEQRVYIKDIADLSGRNGKSLYDQAEEICQKLLDQKVHVRTRTEDGRRRYKGYNCMSTCEYVEGSGYIEAKFNDDMRPFLLQLKRRFTQYNLQSFMQLSSQHSMRIYELLKMREGLRYLRISVEELREILCCEHSYERFTDFRRWVLENARDELKEKTDIYFNYKVERNGQTPVRINFIIKQNGEKEDHAQNGEGENGPRLIQADDEQRSKDIGVKNGTSSSSKPQFNVFAMVLDEMTQKELDNRKESKIRQAVDQARAKVQNEHPTMGAANQATHAYRNALREIRGE